MSTTDMKLVVVGAAGRMGQTLIRMVHGMDGVRLHAAVERPGSPFVGRDAGELAGLGPIGIAITDKPLEAFCRSRRRARFHVARPAPSNLPASPHRHASCM